MIPDRSITLSCTNNPMQLSYIDHRKKVFFVKKNTFFNHVRIWIADSSEYLRPPLSGSSDIHIYTRSVFDQILIDLKFHVFFRWDRSPCFQYIFFSLIQIRKSVEKWKSSGCGIGRLLFTARTHRIPEGVTRKRHMLVCHQKSRGSKMGFLAAQNGEIDDFVSVEIRSIRASSWSSAVDPGCSWYVGAQNTALECPPITNYIKPTQYFDLPRHHTWWLMASGRGGSEKVSKNESRLNVVSGGSYLPPGLTGYRKA